MSDEEKPKRPKTGGRQKGTPNKQTQLFREAIKGSFIQEKAMELFEELPIKEVGMKLQILQFLASYAFPKYKDIDWTPAETNEDEHEAPPNDTRGILRVMR